MKSIRLKPEQMHLFGELKKLAKAMGNISLEMGESHLRPYGDDMTPQYVAEFEASVRECFLSSLRERETPLLIRAVPEDRRVLKYDFARVESSRGNIIRMTATNRKWFEENWWFFAADLGPELCRRSIYVFIKYDESSLARLVSPWWNPCVLVSPNTVHSRSLIREVKSRVTPGVVVFSLAFPQLGCCELFFHPDDLDVVTECVCVNAHKQDWWCKD